MTGSSTPKSSRAGSPSAEIKAADPDNDGTLDEKEYLAVVKKKFEAANPDNDGTVDLKELDAGQELRHLQIAANLAGLTFAIVLRANHRRPGEGSKSLTRLAMNCDRGKWRCMRVTMIVQASIGRFTPFWRLSPC